LGGCPPFSVLMASGGELVTKSAMGGSPREWWAPAALGSGGGGDPRESWAALALGSGRPGGAARGLRGLCTAGAAVSRGGAGGPLECWPALALGSGLRGGAAQGLGGWCAAGGAASGGGAGGGRSSRPAATREQGGGGAGDGRCRLRVRGLSSEERGWARERIACWLYFKYFWQPTNFGGFFSRRIL
jgi:hypothetical protein